MCVHLKIWNQELNYMIIHIRHDRWTGTGNCLEGDQDLTGEICVEVLHVNHTWVTDSRGLNLGHSWDIIREDNKGGVDRKGQGKDKQVRKG